MINKNLGLICVSLLISSCQSGSGSLNASSTNAVAMPIFDRICNSANFVSYVNNTIYDDLSISQSKDTCIPWAFDVPYQVNPVNTNIQDNIAQYYYGQNFMGTCPSLSAQSELPFPPTSKYYISQKNIVSKMLKCLGMVNLKTIPKPLVVFDIDDTLIASAYINTCHNGFAYDASMWSTSQSVGAAIAVPEMDKIITYAISNNITIAFITGRRLDEKADTEKDLILAYPQFKNNIQNVFEQNMAYFMPPSELSWSISSFKNNAREQLINNGYNIVLNVGDQYSDMEYNLPYPNSAICSYKLSNLIYYIN